MVKWRIGITVFALLFVFVLVPDAYADVALNADAVYDADTTYVVQPGDNLFRIALRHGLSTQALARANGITDPARVFVGQVLVIPSPGSSSNQVSAAPAPASRSGSTYVVKRGDTLYRVALDHGVSVDALSRLNGVVNPSQIYVGQVLTIPGAGSSATAAPAYAPPSPIQGGAGRWIDIDLSAQRLTAFEGNQAVFSTLVSTGIWAYPTVVGQYRVYHRLSSQTMDGRRLGFDYILPNVPYVMYFYKDFAIHGTYWHSNFGTPMSHGCVNMSTPDAQWLYNWSGYGTLVNVHY